MLVSPETPISGSLPVSIPPSARRVLEELGALDSVDAAGLYPNLGNSVIWADDPPRSEMFSNDSKGYHTDLATLEQILLEVAAQAGVIVHSCGAEFARHQLCSSQRHWRNRTTY